MVGVVAILRVTVGFWSHFHLERGNCSMLCCMEGISMCLNYLQICYVAASPVTMTSVTQ